MTLTSQPLAFTINLDFVQVRDLVLQMPDEERKLMYELLKSEFENKFSNLYSDEELEALPEEEPEVSEEAFYESLKEI